MHNKINNDSAYALLCHEKFKRNHAQVTVGYVNHVAVGRVAVAKLYYRGNHIASHFSAPVAQLVVMDAGYQTVTTKRYLNAVLSMFDKGYIFQKDWEWYITSPLSDNPEIWAGRASFNIHYRR
ncbi:hypothetical protein NVP1139A_56 [Vibrio phage 1.139.A._10N.261.48.C6]|nr:hypothetical protein NVP1034O_55 [Vibrio phage 1.034.O._10N.261.46.B7]AUR83486.1 hypothetical protein NVP1034X_56 [Vibrio phage 1.034.X._10N.261.46.B7]AUR90224.1 hypothetical protein NVP1139A_56 [Vibrio phage 1.139.A._10N.261.48.C6]AUR90291.1 hypothetical protein NVP1139B_56 [Vibrio phage 1.139.B._10N.261.48.C6]AUR95612.1 hypothetical protein NVP1209O_55 [Vibrio phage 1.209.O._10N.222.52.B2]